MGAINSKSLIDDAIFSFSIGDEKTARNTLLKVLESDPDNLDALRAISEVFLSLNELESSELYCRRALKTNPKDLTSMVSLARILVKRGDKEGAEDASSKARILGWKEELASDLDDD
jgi:predicted Zn-dependent protease|tara:strand:- start:511 stop:861 length:351 start_codon:yes stop_codon:yes gene_type:complete